MQPWGSMVACMSGTSSCISSLQSGKWKGAMERNLSSETPRKGTFDNVAMHKYRSSASSKQSAYEKYEAQIKACFSRWPAAAKFYQSLIDHLHIASSSGWSSLQKPTTYLLDQSAGRSDRSKTGSTTSLASNNSNSSVSLLSPTPAAITEQARLGRHPHITVVEGFLAPETIGILGEWHRTRPEFFIDSLAPSKSCAYASEHNAEAGRCELPLLPSQRENIIHVRFFSQLKLPNKGWKAQAAEVLSTSPANRLDRRRLQLETKRREYEQQLFDHRQYGVTRFRALHIHNEQSLTVEQMVSFTVKESDKIWHGKNSQSRRQKDVRLTEVTPQDSFFSMAEGRANALTSLGRNTLRLGRMSTITARDSSQ
jgi:hypothetical protein